MTLGAAAKAAIKALLGPRAIARLREGAAAVDAERGVAGLEIARRTGVPLYLDERMHPRWVLERGRVAHRVFLTTIPKAGTYMMAKMLPRLGVADCGIHVLRQGVVDHRFAPERLRRHFPSALSRSIEMADALRLIAPGQFAFGHLGLKDGDVRALLADFKVVLMIRDLRDVYVSLLRFFREIRRDMPALDKASLFLPELKDLVAWDLEEEGPYRLIGFRHLAAWRGEPNVHTLRYEEVVGDAGSERQMEVMRGLRDFLGSPAGDRALADILATVVGQPTMTKTESRTLAAEHWDDEVERLYRRVGFPALNRELGYEEPAGASDATPGGVPAGVSTASSGRAR